MGQKRDLAAAVDRIETVQACPIVGVVAAFEEPLNTRLGDVAVVCHLPATLGLIEFKLAWAVMQIRVVMRSVLADAR